MDAIEKLVLLAETGREYCILNHGPGTKKEDYPAANFIVCPLGTKETDIVEVVNQEVVIPVCEECQNGLQDKDWVLIFCLSCLENQWIYRPTAKLHYRHNIIWLGNCVKCTNEFGGIYFNDDM